MSWAPTGLGLEIFNQRYALEGESWTEACARVAGHVAQAEASKFDGAYHAEKFEAILADGLFMPGGRIWANAGKPKPQLLNCFVLPVSDSREGWGKAISDTIIVSGLGGGVGINCSPIRPRGSEIKGTGGYATGAVSFMEMVNAVGDVLRTGGGRRLALMLALEASHPDLDEFLDKKLDRHQLNNANVSVILKEKEDIDKLVASGTWERIVRNAWESGEPGVLNGFEANRMSNIWYHKPLVCTNPCVTGDTVIATLDGPRRFDELAADGRDALVYAWHPETKKPVVRMMRRPHKTRFDVPILEVEFDSGLKVRCTPDHNFYSFRGKKVQAQDLRIGSSVRAWSMSEHRDGHLRVHGWDTEADRASHQWVSRIVYENFYGQVPEGMIVHHIDEDKRNNHISNLEILTPVEHNALHYPARFEAGFDGTARNHKVVAIREAGTADVYNGCVDDAHTYIILDPEPVAGIQSGIVSANCGEIWLEEYGCCDLGALVLPRFVKGGYVDYDLLKDTVRSAVRFLDNVLDVNHYPLAEIQHNCLGVRRIGLGVMGLHSALLELGYKYSSEAGRRKINDIFSAIKEYAYEASIELAKEKGPFPAARKALLQSGFAKTLPLRLRKQIEKHGLRNCALLTVAPTGTTGMVHGVSTGIEPLFAPAYYRRFWEGEHLRKELVLTEEFKRFGSLAEGAYDVSVEDHFEVQKIVQSHVDNAVSKTINLPEDYDPEDLSDIWLDYLPHLKGSTFYREGSRGQEPLEPIRGEAIEAIQHLTNQSQQGKADIADQYGMDCVSGSCEI